MIPELDRYHGVVLRQMLVTHGHCMRVGVADAARRVDAFFVEGAAFQVKHSSKRLSPWHFTYLAEAIDDLLGLAQTFDPVWVFLVCGQDGVVGISLPELTSIVRVDQGRGGWVRVSRKRNAMYRVGGALGELLRAKPRGVHAFLADVFRREAKC